MIDNKLIKIDGFKGNAINSGVKYQKYDLAIIYSEEPCTAAGVFTKNKTVAAPVVISKEKIENKNKIKAIVINSGNANACTGKKGLSDAKKICSLVAKELNIHPKEILVASTGIIGKNLPMDLISSGIEMITKDLTYENFYKVPEGIMTTDKFTKTCSTYFQIEEQDVKINGLAKGSGMIHPNMGTMLGFFTTNVNIDQSVLQTLIKDVTDDTFNMISVDGDTSTNDSVMVITNNQAKHNPINSTETEAYKILKKHFYKVFEDLAIKIAKDGEGASKLLEVNLTGALSKADAKLLSKSVIQSSLVKSAFFGEDANWGRILCALGYSGAELDPTKVDLVFKNSIGSVQLLKNGENLNFDLKQAKKILSQDKIMIDIDIHLGDYQAKAWGCDLSYDYVKINANYNS